MSPYHFFTLFTFVRTNNGVKVDYKEPLVYRVVNDDQFNHEESLKEAVRVQEFTLEAAMYKLPLLKRPESDIEV